MWDDPRWKPPAISHSPMWVTALPPSGRLQPSPGAGCATARTEAASPAAGLLTPPPGACGGLAEMCNPVLLRRLSRPSCVPLSGSNRVLLQQDGLVPCPSVTLSPSLCPRPGVVLPHQHPPAISPHRLGQPLASIVLLDSLYVTFLLVHQDPVRMSFAREIILRHLQADFKKQ